MKTILNKHFSFTLVLGFIVCMILEQVTAQTLKREQNFDTGPIGEGESIDWDVYYGGPEDTCVTMTLVQDDTLNSQVMEVVTNPSSLGYSVYCWAPWNPIELNDPHVTFKAKSISSIGYRIEFKSRLSDTTRYLIYHFEDGTDYKESDNKHFHFYNGSSALDGNWHQLSFDLQSDINSFISGNLTDVREIVCYGDARWDDLFIYEGVPSPAISPSSSSLQFSADEGGSNPSSQNLTIYNSGTGSLFWTASEYPDKSWLTLENTVGKDSSSVAVSVNISGLSDSTYTGTIRITDSNAANNPQDVTVTLTVNDTTSSGGSGVWLLSGDDIYYDDGNVGIGTSSPQSELAVNGEITAKEITVTESGWADFVFKPGYYLLSIQQIEEYILNHKRLPDLPSESEVKQNGVSLGLMQVKLLQKIEELTLHMIDMKKENETLKLRMTKLENN